jgi:ribulose-5-phosphate 4-epimerase/fuculose-1-phosphate aldolase
MTPSIPHELLEQLVTSCRILAAVGQGDMVWGHVSVRDPKGRGVWLKGAGHGLEEISADDVVLINRAGEVLAGGGRRHKEFPIHTEVMATRPDVGCVIHTHPAAPVTFAAVDEPLRPVSHEATFFFPPELPCFSETSDLILTPQLGERVAAALGDRLALLLGPRLPDPARRHADGSSLPLDRLRGRAGQAGQLLPARADRAGIRLPRAAGGAGDARLII